MSLSKDAIRIKEMCERRRSFVALQIADEMDPAQRLAHIRALNTYDEVLSFIAKMERENEINVTS